MSITATNLNTTTPESLIRELIDDHEFKEAYETYAQLDRETMMTKMLKTWIKDAGLFNGNWSDNSYDIAYTKAGVKTSFKKTELFKVLLAVSKDYSKATRGYESTDAINEFCQLLKNQKRQLKSVTANKSVTDRLTDVSKYTGSHKHRFNPDGTGRGIDGREYRAENKGYVSGYKGQGTYEKKPQQK